MAALDLVPATLSFTHHICPCEDIPCGACEEPTPDDRAVLLDQAGDEGENAVCVACAIELALPVCQKCGDYCPDSNSCIDCEHDCWRNAV